MNIFQSIFQKVHKKYPPIGWSCIFFRASWDGWPQASSADAAKVLQHVFLSLSSNRDLCVTNTLPSAHHDLLTKAMVRCNCTLGILHLWLQYRPVDRKLSINFLVDPSRRQVGHPWNRILAYITHTTTNKATHQHYKSSLLLPLRWKKIYNKVTWIIIDCDECSTYWQNHFDFMWISKS